MATENLWAAFGLTLFAGLCTGIGSALAFLTKRTNKKFLSLALVASYGDFYSPSRGHSQFSRRICNVNCIITKKLINSDSTRQ